MFCPLPELPRSAYPAPKVSPSVLRDDAVDDSVLLGLLGAHEVITFGISPNFLKALTGVVGDDLIETPAHVDDLARVDLDVGRPSLEGRGHLVDEDLGVGERHPL